MTPNKRNEQVWLPSLLTDFFTEDWPTAYRTYTKEPAMNIVEREQTYQIEIAVPGITKEDIAMHINEQDCLVVSVEKKSKTSTENCDCKDGEEKKCTCKYLRHEFSFAHFEQSFILPDDVNKEAIVAKVTDGILRIELPKLDPTAKKQPTRIIDIQ